jgi:hypothetical protein
MPCPKHHVPTKLSMPQCRVMLSGVRFFSLYACYMSYVSFIPQILFAKHTEGARSALVVGHYLV